jgi:hypothetical protein
MENKEITEDKTPENEDNSKQPQPTEKSYFKKYGKPIIASVTIIIVVVILARALATHAPPSGAGAIILPHT